MGRHLVTHSYGQTRLLLQTHMHQSRICIQEWITPFQVKILSRKTCSLFGFKKSLSFFHSIKNQNMDNRENKKRKKKQALVMLNLLKFKKQLTWMPSQLTLLAIILLLVLL